MFDYTREHENDFSFWYPKIKDCGIPTPLTFYTKLPSAEEEPEYAKQLYEAFYMEHPKVDEEVVKAYLEERVIPKLKEMGLTGHVFVKNGRFSNKFNANGTCNLYGLHELYRAIILINYEAICCGADGADEIVVRKFIESSAGMTPCIYNGLPLRPEFRVFYDFDAENRSSPRIIGTMTMFTRTCTTPPTRLFSSMSEKDWKACMHTSRMPFRTRLLMQCRMCKD